MDGWMEVKHCPKMRRGIEAFKKGNYSRSWIAKELDRSINVIFDYLNAHEDYGSNLWEERRNCLPNRRNCW